MKKGIILTLVAGGFLAATLVSCGEKFTPMTEEQISLKVDTLYNEQKEAKLQELRAACDARVEAEATTRFEDLKNAAVAEKK